MSVTITVQPNAAMWQEFFAAHYAADHRLKLRFWYGFACLGLGAFGLGGLFASKVFGTLLLAVGLYCVLSRPLLVLISLRKARRSPAFLRATTYTAAADGLTISNAAGTIATAWHDFDSYRLAAPGLLLYQPDRSFLFIPRAGCPDADWAELLRLLQRSRLRLQ